MSHRLFGLTPSIILSALVLLLTARWPRPHRRAPVLRRRLRPSPAKSIRRWRETGSARASCVKWQYGGRDASWCETGWYSLPAVADLDHDGQAEVIGAAYTLWALNGATGAVKWSAANGSRVRPGVAVADLTGDGTLEVIAGRGGDQLTVYNAAGARLARAHPFGGGEVRTLAVADLEGDGRWRLL